MAGAAAFAPLHIGTDLPDTSLVFSRLWGAVLARLALTMPSDQRALLDPGILEVANQLGGMTAIEFMDAEAMRATAGHVMARLHQRFVATRCRIRCKSPPRNTATIWCSGRLGRSNGRCRSPIPASTSEQWF